MQLTPVSDGLDLSTGAGRSLNERRNELTRRLILDAAVRTLESDSVGALTMRAVAERAGMSERTLFRYFATREEFLDAVAHEVSLRLRLPALPASAAELPKAPGSLYRAYQANTNLTKAALHSELFDRIRKSVAQARWDTVKRLIDEDRPQWSERERKIAAANIRYYLSATTWHYYRFYFGFSLKETIASAEAAIGRALAGN
jgi:AcrR family transcriptional regulator